MRRFGLGLIAAALVVAAMPAAAQTPPPPSATRTQSAFPFPERLGEFVLVRVNHNPDLNVLGGRYERPGAPRGSGGVDIFVAAAGMPPEEDLAMSEAAMSRIYANVTPVRSLTPPPGANGAIGRLWRADLAGNAVLTGTLIGARGGWRVKVRATIPQAEGEAGWARIDALLAAFWTGPVPPPVPATPQR